MLLILCLLAGLHGLAWGAAEAPYEADEHTVLLIHFDEGEGGGRQLGLGPGRRHDGRAPSPEVGA